MPNNVLEYIITGYLRSGIEPDINNPVYDAFIKWKRSHGHYHKLDGVKNV